MDVEISFKTLLKTLYRHLAIIIVITVLIGLLTAMYTLFMVTPIYRATSTSNLLITDMNATKITNLNTTITMMPTYCALVKADNTMEHACDRLNNVYTPEELRKLISITYEDGGTIIYISAVSTNPKNASIIANIVAESAQYVLDGEVDWDITNRALVPSSPASPSLVTNIVLGVLVGFVFTYGICLLIDIYNTKIVSEDQIKHSLGVPVLGTIPMVNTVESDENIQETVER